VTQVYDNAEQLSNPSYSPIGPSDGLIPPAAPKKKGRRLRWALVGTAVVLVAGTIGFLSTSLASTANRESHYHDQLRTANKTIGSDNATIQGQANNISQDRATITKDKADINNANGQINNDQTVIGNLNQEISQDQSTIDNLQGQLNIQDEVPPGGYGNFQSDLINALDAQDNVSVSTVDCVLPAAWTPGGTFNCDTFDDNNSFLGSVTITIESNNPDGTPQWEFTWYPANSGSAF
jgi:hypothetical protein